MDISTFEKEFIENFRKRLDNYGFVVDRLEDDENTLVVAFALLADPASMEEEELTDILSRMNDSDEEIPDGVLKELILAHISFLDMWDFPVLQYYFHMREDVTAEMRERLTPVIEECNITTPVGEMGFYEEDLYYRYTQVFRENISMEDALSEADNVMTLMVAGMQLNDDTINEKLNER